MIVLMLISNIFSYFGFQLKIVRFGILVSIVFHFCLIIVICFYKKADWSFIIALVIWYISTWCLSLCSYNEEVKKKGKKD